MAGRKSASAAPAKSAKSGAAAAAPPAPAGLNSSATPAPPPPQVTLEDLFKPADFMEDDLDTGDIDNKPSDEPSLSVAQRLENFNRFSSALRHPDNARVARPFIAASLALFVLPLATYHVVLRVLIPLAGLGDTPLDEAVALGLDRVSLSGVCAVLVSWVVIVSYTVFAFNDVAPPQATGHSSNAVSTVGKKKKTQ